MHFEVSLFPLLLATALNISLGALWYSSVLFGKIWMREAHITQENIEASHRNMAKIYLLTTLSAFFTSYLMGILVANLRIDTFYTGVVLACILWLGTHVPTLVKNWGFEERSVLLGLINHGYDLAVFIITALVFIMV